MKTHLLKVIVLSVTLIGLLPELYAQEILVGASGGIGTFSMQSSKDLNQANTEGLSFNPKLVDNFPANTYYKGEILYRFPKILAVGINAYYTSTGSRLSLADYSGNYHLDNVQKGFFPGVKVLLGPPTLGKNFPNLSLEGGLALSKMSMEEVLNIADESQTYNEDLKSFGYYFQPGISYLVPLLSQFMLSVNVSYYLGFEKTYHLSDDEDQLLYNSQTGEEVSPEWDGFRMGITLYWQLPI